MAQSNVRQLSPGRAEQQYLASMDDDQAVCMSQGHSWPKIRPNKPLPKGIEAIPEKNGQFQVRETCSSCKTVRVWTTLPGGAFDMDITYKYIRPEHWVVRHGEDVTPRDIRAHVWGGHGKLLASSVKSAL